MINSNVHTIEKATSYDDVKRCISMRQPFIHPDMSAKFVYSRKSINSEKMKKDDMLSLKADIISNSAKPGVFVVESHNIPVAWYRLDTEEWFVTENFYSTETDLHTIMLKLSIIAVEG